jgi:tellurite resistance protein
MKRLILILAIILLVVVAVLLKLYWSKPENTQQIEKDKPLSISKNSDAFTKSFSELMSSYYNLKDALVDWDTTKANQAALIMQQRADSLPSQELKADSTIVLTAENLAGSISNEIKGFVGENTIEQKRRAFNMITDELYNLIRTVKYDGETIYHIRCPMAFDEKEEGYWLSNTSKVINPYLGNKHPKYNNKMIGCGEVVDSLSFAKK